MGLMITYIYCGILQVGIGSYAKCTYATYNTLLAENIEPARRTKFKC